MLHIYCATLLSCNDTSTPRCSPITMSFFNIHGKDWELRVNLGVNYRLNSYHDKTENLFYGVQTLVNGPNIG